MTALPQLTCVVTATETAEGLKGSQRDMARTLADRALDCLQPKPTNTP
ncbi:hypothetical protein [Pseudomonas paralactis]